MRFSASEAIILFVLWVIQFVFSGLEAPPPSAGLPINHFSESLAAAIGVGRESLEWVAHTVKIVVTWVYFGWAAIELVRVAIGRRSIAAFTLLPPLSGALHSLPSSVVA